jgi:hypothetical protein
MRMSGAASPWFERDATGGDAAGLTHWEEWINAHRSSEILGRSRAGSL